MTRLRLRLLAWTLVSALSLYTTTTEASVLAIDYGTDFIKASLMKPGVAFDVLLNRDSKRKMAASIAWKGDERLFGTDAVNIVRIYSTIPMWHGLTFPDTGSTLPIRVI
jgi:hypoxia up-regulated 1